MDLPREALKQLFGIFSAEAEEHIEHITRNLLDLEKARKASCALSSSKTFFAKPTL